ncbi:uncharacterized protein [Blastocystis hominis]|uniref:BOP1 N-terminal domain-containing protein n=1 Tax=Blastocystis hominis TaxID=12968 RepID=D8M945_BLAHO|nr:uncharacterized protein [Blastocystis hominis]CBK24584.2 unnamed protein product [Blastocystis hominis]|eukprot:XP_012898632.1 uncharacterized protein [Blastocystis hominis]
MRPKSLDAIDKYIHTHDKNERWTIYDEKEGKEIRLTPRQIAIIKNIQNHQAALPGYDDEPEYIPYASGEVETMPLVDPNPVKSTFIPAVWERRKVAKIMKRMRQGRYKLQASKETKLFYDMWEEEGEERRNAPPSLAAPKLPLPDHSESYNPPEEYLPSESEKREWEEASPEDRSGRFTALTRRKRNFLPQKFACLRRVPLYISEDSRGEPLTPGELREGAVRALSGPVPVSAVDQAAHHDRPQRAAAGAAEHQRAAAVPDDAEPGVRLPGGPRAVDPRGRDGVLSGVGRRWKAADHFRADDRARDEDVRVPRGDPGDPVEPVGVVLGRDRGGERDGGVSDRHRALGERGRASALPRSACRGVEWLVNKAAEQIDEPSEANGANGSSGSNEASGSNGSNGSNEANESNESNESNGSNEPSVFVDMANIVVLRHSSPVKDMAWHHKGDYFCVNASSASASIVYIHQLSKGTSQIPISKLKGLVQRVLFSPSSLPYLFVATQTEVKIYNLVKQTLVNKLRTGVKWVSSMAIHPCGDNLIVGSFDARLSWFDLDLASTPYKTLRYHKKAIRKVQFHDQYPLMSTCSDDGTIHVFHTTVYNDFVHNALIVPLKILRGHEIKDDLGVLDTQFHPTQPWIITAGADHTIRMYINIPCHVCLSHVEG